MKRLHVLAWCALGVMMLLSGCVAESAGTTAAPTVAAQSEEAAPLAAAAESVPTSIRGSQALVDWARFSSTRDEFAAEFGVDSSMLAASDMGEPTGYFIVQDAPGPFGRVTYDSDVSLHVYPSGYPKDDWDSEDLKGTTVQRRSDGKTVARVIESTIAGNRALIVEPGTSAGGHNGAIEWDAYVSWRTADGTEWSLTSPTAETKELVGYAEALAR